MEDGGLVVQNLKCPECGASVKFPDAGSQSVCDHLWSQHLRQRRIQKNKRPNRLTTLAQGSIVCPIR